MRKMLALLVATAMLAGCSRPPGMMTSDLQQGDVDATALAAQAPSHIVITRAETTSSEIRLDYDVIRKGKTLKKQLRLSYEGDLSKPASLTVQKATLNGVALTSNSLSKAEQKMLGEELTAIHAYKGNAYSTQAIGAILAVGAGVVVGVALTVAAVVGVVVGLYKLSNAMN